MKSILFLRVTFQIIRAACFCRAGLSKDLKRRIIEKEKKTSFLPDTPGVMTEFLEEKTFKNRASS